MSVWHLCYVLRRGGGSPTKGSLPLLSSTTLCLIFESSAPQRLMDIPPLASTPRRHPCSSPSPTLRCPVMDIRHLARLSSVFPLVPTAPFCHAAPGVATSCYTSVVRSTSRPFAIGVLQVVLLAVQRVPVCTPIQSTLPVHRTYSCFVEEHLGPEPPGRVLHFPHQQGRAPSTRIRMLHSLGKDFV